MSPRSPLQKSALGAGLLAAVPYLVLKLMWLSGSTVGMTGGPIDEMRSTRFEVGNATTAVLMLVAVGLIVALTRSRADRVPAKVVLVLGAGATGLLTPILLGLPLGMVAQAVARGDVKLAEDTSLEPWVFAVVYSGFALLALAMGALLLDHVTRRWGHLLTQPPEVPPWPASLVGALGLIPFAGAMIVWGSFGPRGAGPRGMDEPAQRTVLLVTGVLSGAAFLLPRLSRSACRWPRITWLIAWTGCCVAALQGPALLLLAHEGQAQPAVAALALLSTSGAGLYGATLLRTRIAKLGANP